MTARAAARGDPAFRLETATLDGRRVAWRAAGTGPPGLLLHCALAHSGAYGGLLDRLADRLAIRAMDLPGHGGTGHDPALGLQAEAAANAVALLAATGPAHVLGHSFGATVALRLALEAPGLVRSLVLIEPVMFAFLADAGDPAYAEEVAAEAPFRAAAARGDWQAAAAAFLGRWGAGGLAPEREAAILSRMPLVAASEDDLHDRPARALRLDDLGRIACPALLVAGAASPPVIHRILDLIAARLPRATRATIPGAGHMVPLTHPESTAAAIRAHLDALPG